MTNHPFIGLAFGICAFGAIATVAAEDQWWPPMCCGEHERITLDPRAVRPIPGGYAVVWHTHTLTFKASETLKSPDGKFHAFRTGDPAKPLRCLHIPFTGA